MREFIITTAGSRKSTNWNTETITWDAFCDRLKKPVRGSETLAEYNKLPKSRRDELKDIGGFVGGELKGSRRLTQNMVGRDLITLDLDNIPSGQTEAILDTVDGLNCTAVVYSTRKHHSRKPRLRIIFPLDRTATPEEYEPLARKLGERIGMDYADPTTFEVGRLMFWPSACSDGEYVCRVFEKKNLASADAILNQYTDWRNVMEWPQIPGLEENIRIAQGKAENPLEKQGIIGAFCRIYSIHDAISELIPGIYSETSDDNRYTYASGSTYGGAVVYNDLFLYSHHGTDPVGGRLVNAWDLVRLHKFGELDEEAKDGTPIGRMPSTLEMTRYAGELDKVKKQLSADTAKEVADSFSEPALDAEDEYAWLETLKTERNGKEYQKTISNFTTIMENDVNLKGKIAAEIFTNQAVIKEPVPWDPTGLDYPRGYSDTDTSQIFRYIEDHYLGLYSNQKGEAAINIVGLNNRYNVIADYLNSLTWDKTPRMETLFIDYLGAEDTEYVRAVTRKMLLAAVRRATSKTPVKYDPMVILTGRQGIGKSTLLRYLATRENWFNDSLTVFEGKDAAELIQGSWIVEIGELSAMNKQEIDAVKSFQTKTTDKYRRAYGRHVEEHTRRCIFVGTTNDDEYLRDVTGNRRYLPVDVGVNEPTKDVFTDLQKEVDQIWAETMAYDMAGSDPILDMDTPELKQTAMEMQEQHRWSSPMEGEILAFLDREIPQGWYSWDLSTRRAWLGSSVQNPPGEIKRQKTCVAEIWVECYGGRLDRLTPQKRVEILNALRALPGWVKNKNPLFFTTDIGRQKAFIRKEE